MEQNSQKRNPSFQTILTFQFNRMKKLAEKKGCSHLLDCYTKILAYEKENSIEQRSKLAQNIYDGL